MSVSIKAIVADIVSQVEAQIPARATRCSIVLKNTSMEVLSGPRSGRTYRKPNGGTYIASAPGEPPAARTSTLMGSFRPIQDEPNVAGIYTSVPYAAKLEEGTSRMARRPYRERTIEQSMPGIEQIMNEPYSVEI
ncbi:MAG: hypothetical protein ACOYJ1_01080 [Peptococcales bacterium]|jgi:hypothetical protein